MNKQNKNRLIKGSTREWLLDEKGMEGWVKKVKRDIVNSSVKTSSRGVDGY